MNQTLLINDANIDLKIVENIFEVAKLPKCKILLILSDGYLPEGYLGCCIPRSLIKYENSIRIFMPYFQEKWDCVVALSVDACNYRKSHESYFAYLIGHELGHVHVCIRDMSTHIFSCILQSFICEASNHKVTKWHEIPHEKLFDQYGIFITDSLFNHDQICSEIQDLIKFPKCKDKDRLETMLSLPPFEGFDALRNDLVTFALPYKDDLIRLWKDELSKAGDQTLLELIEDFDQLFIHL